MFFMVDGTFGKTCITPVFCPGKLHKNKWQYDFSVIVSVKSINYMPIVPPYIDTIHAQPHIVMAKWDLNYCL